MGENRTAASDVDSKNDLGSSSIFGGERDETESTMIGVDMDANGEDIAIVVGEMKVPTHHFAGEYTESEVLLHETS